MHLELVTVQMYDIIRVDEAECNRREMNGLLKGMTNVLKEGKRGVLLRSFIVVGHNVL